MTGDFAGRLRDRIELAEGGACWAQIAPEGHGAGVVADAFAARPRWRILLRAPAAIAVGARLAWRGRALVVLAREDDPGLPDRIRLLCEELP